MTTSYLLLFNTLEACLTPERVLAWVQQSDLPTDIGCGWSERYNPFATFLEAHTGVEWRVTEEKASLAECPFLAYPLPEWVVQVNGTIDRRLGGSSLSPMQFASIVAQTCSTSLTTKNQPSTSLAAVKAGL